MLTLGVVFSSRATHISGGEITIQNIGSDQFTVTMNLFGDCSGNIFILDNNKDITLTSSCTTPQILNMVLQNPGGTEISQLCPAELPNSTCNGGIWPGMRIYTYQATVNLPTICADYQFSFSEPNRNSNITNLNLSTGAQFHVEATLNTQLFPNNSTPRFTSQPIPYTCVNQQVNYNYGVVETDGDSLSFALVGAKSSSTNFISYQTGFTAGVPIPGISVNANTGELSFTPTQQGLFVVVMEVSEYNSIGQLISTTLRDIQFVVEPCTNQSPAAPVGGFTNFTGTATAVGTNEINAAPGENFCLDVTFSDPNLTDALVLTSNATIAMTGATFVQTGTNPATGTVCWAVPTGVNLPPTINFFITSNDEACPISSTNSFAVQVNIQQPANLGGAVIVTPPSCSGVCDGAIKVNMTGGINGNFLYQWTPAVPFPPGTNGDTVANVCAGLYSLAVRDLDDPDPSAFWDTQIVVQGPFPIGKIESTTNDDCDTANCVGIISVSPFGGNGAPFTFNWSDIGAGTGNRQNLCPGVYDVTIMDANMCTNLATYEILRPTATEVNNDSVINVSCFGGSDGVAIASINQFCGPGAAPCLPSSISTIQVGTGTLTNTGSTYPAPYGGNENGARHQFLYLASELTAAGMTTGKIQRLAFNVLTGGQPGLAEFSIKVGCTSSTDLLGGWETGLTTVYEAASHPVQTGWGTIPFDVNYNWDGTSNIVVEICFNNQTSFAGTNSIFQQSSPGFIASRYYAANVNDVCTSGLATGVSGNRPNIRFSYCDAPVTYSWPNPIVAQDTATNLSAGTYILTITNSDNCTDTTLFTVTEPPLLEVNPSLVSGVSCPGVCDAVITINPSGGTPPYTVNWPAVTFLSNDTATVCAGSYVITVTDANNCQSIGTQVVSQPVPLTLPSTVLSPISCNGECDGQIQLTPAGGTPPYTVTFDGNVITAPYTVSGLCDGTYPTTLTDSQGCIFSSSVVVTEPAVLSASGSQSGTNQCFGDCNVTTTLSVTGGTTPYTITWKNGQTGSSSTNVCADNNFWGRVEDSRGCIDTVFFIITQPTELVASGTITSTISCFGECTAGASVTSTGGSGAVSFDWFGINTGVTLVGPVQANLCADNYRIIATDANNCPDTIFISITQPDSISTGLTLQTPVSCNGVCDAELSVNPSGGTGTLNIVWDDNSNGTIRSNVCGNTIVWAEITDANGCVKRDSIFVQDPPAISITINEDQPISCNGVCDGELSATVTGGGTPYSYLWLPTNQTGVNDTALCAGIHRVRVTDANNCVDSASYTLTEPSSLTATFNQTASILCNGDSTGELTIVTSGGTPPYTLSCGLASCPFPIPVFFGGTAVVSGVPAGPVSLIITDANNCTFNVNDVFTEPSVLTGSAATVDATCNNVCDGQATLTVNGGTTTYSVSWSDGLGLNQFTRNDLCAGSHTATVVDANGCQLIIPVVIGEPTPMQATFNELTPVTCNGACDGVVQVTVIGGTPPYTSYTWANSQVGDTRTGACGGTQISVTVVDANGCSQLFNYTPANPQVLTAVINITQNVSCSAICNGTAEVSITGGEAPYNISWVTQNPDTGVTIDSLCSGESFSVQITDNRGCVITENATMNVGANFDVDITGITNVLCNGDSTGQLVATITGGGAGVTYQWSPVPANLSTGPIASNLPANLYFVTVTDGTIGGCSAVDSAVVTEPNQLVGTIQETQSILCNGQSNGQLTASAIGGSGAYSYNWLTLGSNNPVVSGLPSGTYTVVITDGNSCTDTVTYVLVEPTAILITKSVTQPTCSNTCNGEIQYTASGGTGPIVLTHNSNVISGTVSNVCVGTTVVVIATDANGCSVSDTTIMSGPTSIVPNLTIVSVPLCFGDCNGVVSVAPTGGAGNYTFNWSNGESNAINTLICAGLNQSVTITDANGCSAVENFDIVGPSQLNATITELTNITCNGGNNGALKASQTGGVGPYLYNWSNSGNTDVISTLTAGVYKVTITDVNGCQDSATFNIGEPPLITATDNVTNANCGQNDGAATVIPSGGTGNHFFNWTTISPNPGNVSSVSGLSLGTYPVEITDDSGCVVVYNVVVNENGGPSSATFSKVEPTCLSSVNGQLTVNPLGGQTPYTYLWSSGGSVLNQTNTGLGIGIYQVTVTDSNNCAAIFADTLFGPDTIRNVINVTHETCSGASDGTITISGTTGGTGPYTHAWVDGTPGLNRTNLIPNDYVLRTTDALGCEIFDTITINSGVVIIVNVLKISDVSCASTCDGQAIATPVGGVGPYGYSWSSSSNDPAPSNLCAQGHTVTVTDINGCQGTGSVLISGPSPIVLDSAVVSVTPVCGQSNGVVQAYASGGAGAPYTFEWNGSFVGNPWNSASSGTIPLVITDANSCSTTQMVSIGSTGGPGLNVTVTDVLCKGDSTGTGTVTVTSGLPPFSYLWSNGAVSSTVNNLPAGIHTVQVTDGNNCVSINTQQVLEPTTEVDITNVVINTTPTCGATDGEIEAFAQGGTGGLTFTWNSGAFIGNPWTNAPGGIVDLVVEDANGCQADTTVNVNVIGGPTISIIGTDPSCFNGSNGTATVTVSTGTSPFNYAWNNLQNTQTAVGLTAGTYTVTVTDANSCSSIESVVLVNPTQIEINSIQVVNSTCGVNNGQISVNATGGTGSLIYVWNNADTANPYTVGAGSYALSIYDDNGCSIGSMIPVSDTGIFVANALATDVLCANDCNGTLSVQVNPVGINYTYLWSTNPDDTLSGVSGVCPGLYSVVVTDTVTGCVATDTASVGSPTSIVLDSTQITEPTCGVQNGQVLAFGSGGTGTLRYIWNNTDTINPITNIGAGNLNLTIFDANGCTANTVVPVSNIGAPTLDLVIQNEVCEGTCNGTASITVTGGTGSYETLWFNNSNTTSINGLCDTLIYVQVTDLGSGCIVSDTGTVKPGENPVIQANPTPNTSCSSICNGKVIALTTQGQAPYNYSWSGLPDTGNDVDSLCAAIYSLTVTDALGCSTSSSAEVTSLPALQVAVGNVTNANCEYTNDGAISLIVSSQSQVVYSWTGPSFSSNAQNIANLLPGSYIYTASSANGCNTSDTVIVNADVILNLSATDTVLCVEVDSINLNANLAGGNNPTYQWFTDGGAIYDTGAIIKVPVIADTAFYFLTVTDNGCAASDTAFVKPGQKPTLNVGIDKTIVRGESVTIGGNPTVEFQMQSLTWSPSESLNSATIKNPKATPSQTTTYTINVIDLVGCEAQDSVTITVKDKFEFPSGFSPNGDGVNDIWNLAFLEKYKTSTVVVMNRWGQVVFESEGYLIPWDGKMNGEYLPVGTYYYIIDLGLKGITDPLTGPVTIMR